jgi:hypothetical protein
MCGNETLRARIPIPLGWGVPKIMSYLKFVEGGDQLATRVRLVVVAPPLLARKVTERLRKYYDVTIEQGPRDKCEIYTWSGGRRVTVCMFDEKLAIQDIIRLFFLKAGQLGLTRN